MMYFVLMIMEKNSHKYLNFQFVKEQNKYLFKLHDVYFHINATEKYKIYKKLLNEEVKKKKLVKQETWPSYFSK